MRRKWVKLWVDESLSGTIRFDLTPDERSVWYDFMALAGACRIPGQISANETTPYPHDYIASTLRISEELLERSLEKFKKTGRIHENENGIYITNWSKYQSEYQRQKPYRESKSVSQPSLYVKKEKIKEYRQKTS